MSRLISIKAIVCLLFAAATFVTAQIPAGYYYKAHNKKKDALKTALHEISTPVRVLKYGSGEGYTWQGFYQTDRMEDGSVIDMYSPKIRYFNGFKGVAEMHIEHALPKSWWGGHEWNIYKDLFHLYPSDGSVNMSKSNNPLGIVTGTPTTDNGMSKIGSASYPGYTGNVFEPADEFKGDFARSYFYVSTAYENLAPYWNSPMMNKNTYPVWNDWALNLLKQWHNQDPVSIKERLRNQAVFTIQGNRNPFIDYPELVSYIWGADSISVFPFPAESESFLISPVPGKDIEFGVILQGDTLNRSLFLQGVNINSNVQISLKNNLTAFFLKNSIFTSQSVLQGTETELVFSPQTSGDFRDTLLIQGGGLAVPVKIAVTGKASAQFMTLDADEITPVGAKLNWITDPHATSYEVTVYQGATSAGNLLFSSYVEGTGYNKGVELYNGTGKTIDLSDYTLRKQTNGAGDFNVSVKPEGLLPTGSTYLVAYNIVTNVLKSQAQLVNDSVMAFNGNDAIALYHNGILTDIIGYVDAGSTLEWGKDKTLKRKSEVTHPNAVFTESEWETYPADYFEKLGSHTIQFESAENQIVSDLQPASFSSYFIDGLFPETTYNFSVKSISADSQTKSVNSIRFKTNGLPAPEVYVPEEIYQNAFKAIWEKDLYTDTYLLNLFQLTGNADTTEFEGFDQVIGETGRPLPAGWSGNPGGSYTTATSSGAKVPSIKLQNTGEWIQTKTYPNPVSAFSFMYRFPSGATGSYFIVESLSSGNWVRLDSIRYVNTSKYYMKYVFNADDAVTAFRINYAQKATGNIALDDFSATYGNQDTVMLKRDFPVEGTHYDIWDLDAGTDYYYNVRSVLGGHISPFSETIRVTTALFGGISELFQHIRLQPTAAGIMLKGLSGGEYIRIFNSGGVMVYQQKATSDRLSISLPDSGVYIISVIQPEGTFHTKFIR